MIIKGKVYDVTSYVEEHPGGDAILRNAGCAVAQPVRCAYLRRLTPPQPRLDKRLHGSAAPHARV